MTTFRVQLIPFIRQFEKQRESTRVQGENWVFEVDTLEDFLSELFLHCQPFFKREIIVDPLEKTHQFGEKEAPDQSDIGKFVKIKDPIAKYTYEIDAINEAKLQTWSDERELNVIIFPHSHSIVYRYQWDAIHKGPTALIQSTPTDKSGAPSESAIEEMVNKLKERHRMHYTAMYIHWRAWSEWILKHNENHEDLINRPPPAAILRFFESAMSNARIQIATVRENVNIAEGINDGFGREIRSLISDFEGIITLSTHKLEAEKAFKTKLIAFEQKYHNNKDNLALFAAAHRPQETPLSETYFNNIGNQEDIDHVDEENLSEEHLNEEHLNEEFLNEVNPNEEHQNEHETVNYEN